MRLHFGVFEGCCSITTRYRHRSTFNKKARWVVAALVVAVLRTPSMYHTTSRLLFCKSRIMPVDLVIWGSAAENLVTGRVRFPFTGSATDNLARRVCFTAPYMHYDCGTTTYTVETLSHGHSRCPPWRQAAAQTRGLAGVFLIYVTQYDSASYISQVPYHGCRLCDLPNYKDLYGGRHLRIWSSALSDSCVRGRQLTI